MFDCGRVDGLMRLHQGHKSKAVYSHWDRPVEEDGVFSSILRELLSRRKAVKQAMKALAEGSVAYNQAGG